MRTIPLSAVVLLVALEACGILTGSSDDTPTSPIDHASVADAAAADAADAGVADAAVEAAPLPPVGCNGATDCERVVFVTSGTFSGGELGGANADAKCQAAADSGTASRVQRRVFKAWLGTLTTSPNTALPAGTKPYVRPDLAVVAKDWSDMIDGTLALPIQVDENGKTVAAGTTWTGSTPGGVGTSQLCDDWASSGTNHKGTTGDLAQTDSRWSNEQDQTCDTRLHLYCVEY